MSSFTYQVRWQGRPALRVRIKLLIVFPFFQIYGCLLVIHQPLLSLPVQRVLIALAVSRPVVVYQGAATGSKVAFLYDMVEFI